MMKAEMLMERLESNGVVMSIEEFAKYDAMDSAQLSRLIHQREMEAARARYVLWRRLEKEFVRN